MTIATVWKADWCILDQSTISGGYIHSLQWDEQVDTGSDSNVQRRSGCFCAHTGVQRNSFFQHCWSSLEALCVFTHRVYSAHDPGQTLHPCYLSKESWVMDSYTSIFKDLEYLGCEDELYFPENGYKKFLILPDWPNMQLCMQGHSNASPRWPLV